MEQTVVHKSVLSRPKLRLFVSLWVLVMVSSILVEVVHLHFAYFDHVILPRP